MSSLAGRGIRPSYSTKAARSGIRVHEIFDQEPFERKLTRLAGEYRKRFGDLLEYDLEDEIQRFREYRPKLAEFCVDAVHLIQNMQKHNAKILVEGANALMLDIDYGTYPCKCRKIMASHLFPSLKDCRSILLCHIRH
jgi:adenylosuccinate synthase